MDRCHACGSHIREGERVLRVVKTGSYSDGGDYHREVVLCPYCDQHQSRAEGTESTKKWLVLAVAVAAAIGLGVWWFFFRQ